MNQAGRTNTAGEKLGLNSNVSTDVCNNSAWKQRLLQQLSFRRISVGFVSGIKRAVDWKGVFVNFVSNSAEDRSYRH
jgi:hypothetical protein